MSNFVPIFHIHQFVIRYSETTPLVQIILYLTRLLNSTAHHAAELYIRLRKVFRLQEVIYRIERLWKRS